MILTVLERLLLLNSLPREGDITSLRITRKLREDLSFSEAEHKALQFREEDGGTFWNKAGDIPGEVPIGEKANDIIVKALKDLSAKGKLTDELIDLYDKFIKE